MGAYTHADPCRSFPADNHHVFMQLGQACSLVIGNKSSFSTHDGETVFYGHQHSFSLSVLRNQKPSSRSNAPASLGESKSIYYMPSGEAIRGHPPGQEIMNAVFSDPAGCPRIASPDAYNKMDLLSPSDAAHSSGWMLPDFRRHWKRLKELLMAVEKPSLPSVVEKELLFPYDQGARLASCMNTWWLSRRNDRPRIRVRVRTHPATLAQWLSKKYDTRQ